MILNIGAPSESCHISVILLNTPNRSSNLHELTSIMAVPVLVMYVGCNAVSSFVSSLAESKANMTTSKTCTME